ncbi:RrF2 family transcriptional regulator [Streptomonospora salina]|uniref:Rrf2 family protein n=1 Tax=Streptomonospora salina TaxID=104205 RepID=A0A841EIW5_9ACTN|nr:Rrf2 family transcriptional regulator [Streptomonospora salina]MBB6000983.1 Rrf2 family protein [Streptomonospora salina]
MAEGVEWALHSCLNLAWVGPERAVPAAALAAFYDLPAAYLNKQLQALARAGVVYSTRGPGGGFRLARDPGRITLLDVVVAIEGREEAFQCTEIRQRGPGAAGAAPSTPCLVDQAMRRAEIAWRTELADQTIAELQERVSRAAPEVPVRARQWLGAAP